MHSTSTNVFKANVTTSSETSQNSSFVYVLHVTVYLFCSGLQVKPVCVNLSVVFYNSIVSGFISAVKKGRMIILLIFTLYGHNVILF